ncbi:MAG: response regulator [bacterium]|nr:response regulator [bacterium]
MKKVLTVDDSKVVRSMVARHLQPYGCEVIEAQNGQEGYETAKASQPDLVLLDVTMPVMDGKACLAAIRGDAATRALPVIMLTAESGRELVVEIAKLGVAGYIVKPFQKDGFEREVSKVLGPPSAEAAVVAAAASTAQSTDDLVAALLAEDDGCQVFAFPDPRSKLFGKMLPVVAKQLRSLAQGGAQRLIVDLVNVTEVNADVVKSLVGLLGEAEDAGLRTAICAPNVQVVESLKQIAETQNSLYATRDAARAGLQ